MAKPGGSIRTPLIVGLAALALAEVFRQGSKLRADTQGLV